MQTMRNVRRKEVYIENNKTHVQNVIGAAVMEVLSLFVGVWAYLQRQNC